MKKLRIAAALLLCFALLLPCAPSRAAQDVIFVVLNNVVLRPISAATMPLVRDGEVYVPYTLINEMTTLKYYYNESMRQMLVYNFWERITFDLAENRSFDDAGNLFAPTAFAENGTVYLPIGLICAKFNIYFSFTQYCDLAPMVRINESDFVGTDAEFTAQVYNLFKTVYNDYLDSVSGKLSSPGTPKEHTRLAYIVFTGSPSIYGEAVLSLLNDTSCAFFFTPDEIYENGAFIRRLASNGYTIGIMLDPAANALLSDQVLMANRRLRECACISSRLVMIRGGCDRLPDDVCSNLTEMGLRLWDSNIRANAFYDAERPFPELFAESIGAMTSTAMLEIDFSRDALAALPNIFDYLSNEVFRVLKLAEWSTPINNAGIIK